MEREGEGERAFERERERVSERVKERVRNEGKAHVLEASNRDHGGWVPVIRNHRSRTSGWNMDKVELFTLFIDNIPDDRDQHWLSRTFNKFGAVKDAFIPRKRSKCSGNKFGFVRFGCQVSAGMAVSKMNGVWVDDKRLFVKEACFDLKDQKRKPTLPRLHGGRVQGSGRWDKHPTINVGRGGNLNESGASTWNKTNPRRSFVQTLMGETSNPTVAKAPEIIIQSDGVGNGWLLRSAIAVLRRVVSLTSLKATLLQ